MEQNKKLKVTFTLKPEINSLGTEGDSRHRTYESDIIDRNLAFLKTKK